MYFTMNSKPMESETRSETSGEPPLQGNTAITFSGHERFSQHKPQIIAGFTPEDWVYVITAMIPNVVLLKDLYHKWLFLETMGQRIVRLKLEYINTNSTNITTTENQIRWRQYWYCHVIINGFIEWSAMQHYQGACGTQQGFVILSNAQENEVLNMIIAFQEVIHDILLQKTSSSGPWRRPLVRIPPQTALNFTTIPLSSDTKIGKGDSCKSNAVNTEINQLQVQKVLVTNETAFELGDDKPEIKLIEKTDLSPDSSTSEITDGDDGDSSYVTMSSGAEEALDSITTGSTSPGPDDDVLSQDCKDITAGKEDETSDVECDNFEDLFETILMGNANAKDGSKNQDNSLGSESESEFSHLDSPPRRPYTS